MRAVLPGKPQAKLQAVCTGQYEGKRLIAYISNNALVVLTAADDILQTIYNDEGGGLEAVVLDEASGKLATCSGSNIYVYRPYGQEEGMLKGGTKIGSLIKWSLQRTIDLSANDGVISTLSWGNDEELLAGSNSLTLVTTNGSQSVLWTNRLANPAKLALLSYDASLIASTGRYDRLVKLWRRLSYGSDEVRFDFTYLPHPTTVTGMHWRRPYHREQTIENVLYTLCADSKLRIWAPTNVHDLQILQLWAVIDLQESIKPRHLFAGAQSSSRFAFIIDSRDFTLATERAVQRTPKGEQDRHALEHLIEVANRSPEVCVVLDGRGNMSAWGIENVGCKSRKATDIFNIAHVEGLKLSLPRDAVEDEQYVQFLNFCGDQPAAELTVLAHYFDGRIEWLEGRVDELCDPSPRKQRLVSKCVWSGHAGPIKKIVRTATGRALVSRTNDNEGLVWKQKLTPDGTNLVRQSTVKVPEHIHRTCVLNEGDFVIFLHHQSISLWDTRSAHAIHIATCGYEIEGKPLCLILLPEIEPVAKLAHVATISSDMKGIAWEVRPPGGKATNGVVNGHGSECPLREFARFDLGTQDDLCFVLPVDPAGSVVTISGFVDTFARDVAISYTNSGVLKSWTAKVDHDDRDMHWLATSTVETGIDSPSLASGTSIRKIALVDAEKTELTIWDSRGAQLEYKERFETQEMIQDLDWTSTPDGQSILAVGFAHRVLLLSQLRYDYLDAGPAWASIREIRIRDFTPHPIGDSIWLSSGNLVVGAGNQLFVYDKKVKFTDELICDLRLPSHQLVPKDLFTVVTRLNGPLPIFHPQFLAQCVLSGKPMLVQRILINLHKKLTYFGDGDELDSFLGISLEDFQTTGEEDQTLSIRAKTRENSSYIDFVDDDESDTFTEAMATSINEKLARIAIPQLSGQEQIHLMGIIECAGTVERHRRSIDDNASRYLLFFKEHTLRKGQATTEQASLSWREIVWAFHCNSQEILIDLVSRQFQGKMLWEHARESGMFMWMRDLTALRAQFEVVARNHYTKTNEKNPIDCSLYYLALKKKNVLLGLWRMASWNHEQTATRRFLSNNFQESRWKTAALKNAYALLGKHRFEYAAAFFLLADCLKDAVNICWNQLNDVQLAIAVARVYEGDNGPILKELLEERVLPQAAREGNRWLATWAFWMLNRRDMAVRTLVSPVYTLLDRTESPGLEARLFLSDDPALVVLYRQLREKTLQTLQGASKISPRVEWNFVLHNSRLYDRMGCDILALELVRNWEFLRQPPEQTRAFVLPPDPRLMLRRRSSLVVADLPSSHVIAELKAGGVTKSTPTVFEEPEASSLLDSFGF
ncbi:MAG: regulator of (H+)-ATPase in vacuolar membrane [Geoglossum umbratile]|nr:MAG: regulator of (H+)-ATPase in vacuolar membrane [Geoglossum umbratile]